MLEGFSRQYSISQSTVPEGPASHYLSRLPRRIYHPGPSTGLDRHFQSTADLAFCVPPLLGRQEGSTGILNLLPITYAFRPRLRDRLTLGGRTFPRKSWDYGGRDSHPAYRYSCPHNHFHAVHVRFPLRFDPHGTLLYHIPTLLRGRNIRGIGRWFKSRSFSAQDHSTSQLLRTV